MCNFAYFFSRYIWKYDKARSKIIFSFWLHTRWKKMFRGISGYMLSLTRKSKYTVHSLKISIFTIFFFIKMSHKSGQEWFINKSLWKYLQNTAKCITGKSGVHRCYIGWDGCTGWQKTHFEKTAVKDLNSSEWDFVISFKSPFGHSRLVTDRKEMPIFGLDSVVQETQSFTAIPVMTDFSEQTDLGVSRCNAHFLVN